MHDLRLYFVQNLGKRRIIVEVKLTVEPHRLDAQCIAAGVRAFQWNDAALVAPEGWDDDGQSHVGLTRQCCQFDLVLPDDTRLADHEDAHKPIIN